MGPPQNSFCLEVTLGLGDGRLCRLLVSSDLILPPSPPPLQQESDNWLRDTLPPVSPTAFAMAGQEDKANVKQGNLKDPADYTTDDDGGDDDDNTIPPVPPTTFPISGPEDKANAKQGNLKDPDDYLTDDDSNSNNATGIV